MRKLLFLLALIPVPAIAQCTFKDNEPSCDRAAFRRTFASVANVSFNRSVLDPNAGKQVYEALTSLGKHVIADSDHPGLVFILTQPDLNGVFVGPSGVVLARLRVYAPNGRTLLWEETYTDQPDVPWPSAVLYLLQQFHDHVTKP